MRSRSLSVLARRVGVPAALVLATSAIVLAPIDGAGAAGPTVVVKPSAMNGWLAVQENPGPGGVSFAAGPAIPPSGTGSARIQLGAATTGWTLVSGTAIPAGTPLSALTTLSYDTYRTSADAGNNLAITLQIPVDFDVTDASTPYQGRLVFEPYQTFPGGVPGGTWQHWDALAGEWWQSSPVTRPPVVGDVVQAPQACVQATPCTLATLLSAFPDLGVHPLAATTHGAIWLKAGSGWSSFDGNVDNVTVGVSGSDITFDFEPETACTTVCYVDDSGNDAFGGDTPASAKKTIQAAINAVSAGGEVRVLPGSYYEAAPGSTPTSLAGTYQFGLFFGSAKPGVSVIGVTAADVAITDANATEATITTNATNNFGYSGIFVEAADITIQGVEIGPNTPSDNKTIEVIGDNFTLRHSTTSIPGGGGSVYINDFSAGGTVVQSYHVLDNVFPDGTSVDIASGAGNTGPVSGREILRNEFDLGNNGFNAISFNGSGGVPWFVNPVGGAIIEDNTFANSVQYIRARGVYDNSQFDWESYWNDNTFDRAAVALVTETPFDVRTFSSGSFTNIRRIGGTIQGEIGNAAAGDTVLVKSGTYAEDVSVNKSITLRSDDGAAATTIIGPIGGDGATVRVGASGVVVEGFTITRAGNNLADWNNPSLNFAGVAIQGQANDAEIRKNVITGNRTGIDINNSNDNSVHDNAIVDNRTGMLLRNQTDGTTVTKNAIADNWTVGILFLDASLGTNVPVQSAAGSTFSRNDLSGNWYGQVVDRQTGGSLPAPGTNGKNFECNWYGTTSPATATTDSGEPGYAALIPVAYGGTAVAPGGQPDIRGPGSANVDYQPFLITSDLNGDCNGGTARGLKQAVLAELQALAPVDQHTDKRIDEAIKHLQKSLDNAAWVDDSHLDGKKAEKVFDEERETVKKLEEIKNPSPALAASIAGWIDAMVAADRALATTAIAEGGSPADLAKATSELAKGDADRAAGDYRKAIDHYKKAWKALDD